MIKKLLRILAGFALLVCVLGAGLAAYASHAVGGQQGVAFPAIAADTSSAGIARGAVIFHATCEACHRGTEGDTASGAPMREAPDWFGALHSANITSDTMAGVGGLADASLARTIRYGVDRDGRWIPMPAYAMSDADVAAVIGFMRSKDPLFRADSKPAPKSVLSLAGKTALFAAGATKAPERPASGIVAPPRAGNVEYGRYLSDGVYQCGDCHTPGFGSDKLRGPDAFTGGGEMKDAQGRLILSPNLTKHEQAGIGRWTRAEFALAVREGIRPDGRALSYPMPHFRGADDVEVEALFQYLRSFPASPNWVHREVASQQPPAPAQSPEQRFAALGCAGCHGQGARYAAKLASAKQKPASELARWIRNPEVYLPGTIMPTFAPVLDERAALELAEWIRQGGG